MLELAIEDIYTVIYQLQLFNSALKGQLSAIVLSRKSDTLAPEHIGKAALYWQRTSNSLDAEKYFGYRTAEDFIENMRAQNLCQLPRTLATAGAYFNNVLTQLASLEYCIWLEECRVNGELLGLKGTTRTNDAEKASAQELRLRLFTSQLTRAEARRDLEVVIAELSTPWLKVFRYRPDIRLQEMNRSMVPAPLPLTVTSVDRFFNQGQFFSASPIRHGIQNVDVVECLLCHENSTSDPDRDDEHITPQLLIYSSSCCHKGPYHVSCMLSYMRDEDLSKAKCPTCSKFMGLEFFVEVMERRVLELRSACKHKDTGTRELMFGEFERRLDSGVQDIQLMPARF